MKRKVQHSREDVAVANYVGGKRAPPSPHICVAARARARETPNFRLLSCGGDPVSFLNPRANISFQFESERANLGEEAEGTARKRERSILAWK